jgi:hypothetical protein
MGCGMTIIIFQYGKTWRKGERFQLILSNVIMGKTLTITDMSYYGKPCKPGYNSHSLIVTKQPGGAKPPPFLYRVVRKIPVIHKALSLPYGDEIVVFDTKQVLPTYIVSAVYF